MSAENEVLADAETIENSVQRPRIVAAIPAFNEGVAIGSVILKAKQYANEVVVIDDGSTDDTAEVAALAGAYVIRHARNLGKGMAIRSAWLYARQSRPDALVLIDGDHQHEPNDIPRLIEPVLGDNADVVLGVRWGKTSGMPTYRRIGKRVLDYATSAGVKGGMVTDSQCGYRVFSKKALGLIEPAEAGQGVESQMLVEAQEKGLRIQEMDIRARYDVEGSTYPAGRHGLGVLGRILSLVSERRPLFFFGISGAVLLVVAALLAVFVVATYVDTGELAIGFSFIVVLFAILGSLSIFVGILLNVMRRVMARA